MIEFRQWSSSAGFADKPWLVLGKGPTFARRGDFDLGAFNLLSLNHVVRELRVDVAHMIDVDVAAVCGSALLANARYVVMPRYPHIDCRADAERPLESFLDEIPALRELDEQGRLVWYNLRHTRFRPGCRSPVIPARYFSSEAAIGILARMGVKSVRSLGVDGGRTYAAAFKDLEGQTLLANTQPTFDLQFDEIGKLVEEYGLDYQPLVPPMRVFVGVDESQEVASQVLEYSIRKHASMPVEVVHMDGREIRPPRGLDGKVGTGFSFSRFTIPERCGHRGRALYVDADMQVFADIAELWDLSFGATPILCTNQPEPPEVWRNNKRFRRGRQYSVMLLDCERLPWSIEQIVRDLAQGRYGYEDLLFEMCLVGRDQIAEMAPEWNHLEKYEEGVTKLIHYTVVPTQPWKNDRNPLCGLWQREYEEAVAAGAVSTEAVLTGIRGGHLKPSLAGCLPPLGRGRAAGTWAKRLGRPLRVLRDLLSPRGEASRPTAPASRTRGGE